jgi:hypothetical protein
MKKPTYSDKDKKLIDATIMALYHVTGEQFSDACEDSDFGNELLEWLSAHKKRITTRPVKRKVKQSLPTNSSSPPSLPLCLCGRRK